MLFIGPILIIIIPIILISITLLTISKMEKRGELRINRLQNKIQNWRKRGYNVDELEKMVDFTTKSLKSNPIKYVNKDGKFYRVTRVIFYNYIVFGIVIIIFTILSFNHIYIQYSRSHIFNWAILTLLICCVPIIVASVLLYTGKRFIHIAIIGSILGFEGSLMTYLSWINFRPINAEFSCNLLILNMFLYLIIFGLTLMWVSMRIKNHEN
jgi:hypothetical protein